MFIVRYKNKTSQKLIDLGCPKWIDVVVEKFETLKAAAEYCRAANKHVLKFHHDERAGKSIYYIKEQK